MSANPTAAQSFDATSAEWTDIRPRAGRGLFIAAELWRYRDLLWFMAKRDVQVRYKQTALGALWAIIQPLAMMAVLHLFFTRAQPMALYAALLPWTFFAASVTATSNSLVTNAAMLQKIYFPRLILPLAALGAPLVDLAVASIGLAIAMAWTGTAISSSLLLLPLILLTVILAALGVGIGLAALSVTYRDFRYVVPFLVQLWFFVTPVAVPIDGAPAGWRAVLAANPISGSVVTFRAAVLGQPIDGAAWAVSTLAAVICLALSLLYFSRTQSRFADTV